MEEGLQALIDAGTVSAKAATALERLRPGTYCFHKSWGFGQVREINGLVNQIVIDFQSKRAHPMQLQYAADALQPLPETHIFVRKTLHPEELKRLAQNAPEELLAVVVASFDGKVTQDQLQKALAPEVITEGAFKKWWDSAKKVVRKGGRFALPAKKTDPILPRDQSVSFQTELLTAFTQARQPKEAMNIFDQVVKDPEGFSDEQLQSLVSQVEAAAGRNARLSAAFAAELLLGRDELVRQRPGLTAGELSVAQLLRDGGGRLADLAGQVSTAKQRALLAETRHAFPEDWAERLLKIVPTVSYRMVGDIAKLLEESGHLEAFRHHLLRTLHEHSITSDVLYWLCRERASAHYADLVQPELLAAVLSAIERDQFNENRRSSKLHDLLLDDRELIPDLLANAASSGARDLMRRMMMTPAFEELNKRSLLARMIRVHPELQSMLSSDSETQEEALVVSWGSLQKRKDEYDDLVARRIPENTKEIAVARSYGDLRENFEYKAAKEMQTVLMRRKAELEQMLARARGTGFENADTSQVSIGTTVTLRDVRSGEVSMHHVMGAWDSDPERQILSYQTALGQALLGKRPGERVELPTETATRMVELVSVAPLSVVEPVGATA